MGANVLGGCRKSDWPNKGSGRPAESATICSNSVRGRIVVAWLVICEGFGGGGPGTNWSALLLPEFVKTGVLTGAEFPAPWPAFAPWPCPAAHCELPAMDGSLQSTPSEGVFCDIGSLRACDKLTPVEKRISKAKGNARRVAILKKYANPLRLLRGTMTKPWE